MTTDNREQGGKSQPGALAGLRVLDMTRVLAGPFAAQILGDLGADVIKVEHPARGDDTRQWGPPFLETADGARVAAYYLAANRNKRAVAIDFAKPAGRELVLRLVERADVLLENYKVGTLARYGLDHESLARRNPRLIQVSITGFGQTGPWRARPGYDFLIQALSGLMSITGEPDRAPMKVGVAMADLLTGLYAVIGVLAALAERARSGRGQHLDLALFEATIGTLANQAMNYLVSGQAPHRQGNAHPNIVPYQDFPTADTRIVICVGNDRQFAALCAVLGHGAWADDPRFATNAQRVAHREILVGKISEVLMTQPAAHWLAALEKAGITAGPIQDIAAALTCPQAVARELVRRITDPRRGVFPGLASPLRLSRTPPSYRRPPPKLGEHSEQILAELGCTPAEIARLRREAVIA